MANPLPIYLYGNPQLDGPRIYRGDVSWEGAHFEVLAGPLLPQTTVSAFVAGLLNFSAEEIAARNPKELEITLHFDLHEPEDTQNLSPEGDYPHTYGPFKIVVIPDPTQMQPMFFQLGWIDFSKVVESRCEYCPTPTESIWVLRALFPDLYH